MKHHNPGNVPLTAAEIDAGWRICFLEELRQGIPTDAEFFSNIQQRWLSARVAAGVMNPADERETTFRTKTPVPLAYWGTIHNPAGVTLSPKDILQGWRFCFAEELMIARPIDAKYKECNSDRAWMNTSNPGDPVTPGTLNWGNTYITQTPAPKLAPPTPLAEAEDIFGQLSKIFG